MKSTLKKTPYRHNNFIKKVFLEISHYLITMPGIHFSTNSCEDDNLQIWAEFSLQEMTNLSQYCGRIMQLEGEREGGKVTKRGAIRV